MKSLVFLFFLFSITLNASYCRSIRLQSFSTEIRAEKSLEDFKKFAYSNKTISDLQKKLDFQYKIIKIGKYYMTSIEPVTKKDVVQELLDIIRTKFPDAYPKKIKLSIKKNKKSDVVKENKKSSKDKETIKPPKNKKIVESSKNKEIIKPLKNKKIIESPKNKETTKPSKNTTIKKINKKEIYNYKIDEEKDKTLNVTKNNNFEDKYLFISFAVIIILLLFVIILLKKLFSVTEEKKSYTRKEMLSKEKIQRLKIELLNKEKVLSNATHELRTPMTAIIGLIHMLLEGELSKQQKDYMLHMENSADNMLKIINDILDFSKIQAGKLKIEQTEFNINDILEYALNTISLKAKNNNISILMSINYDVPSYVIGDSFRLGQVIINLLSNAVKFTKDGEVSLKVKKISEKDENVKLKFIVSDSGIGMTESQVKNLFQSYHQADTSITREFGGTGLGLSISKELAKLMGGDIEVQSKKDVGSTFTFTIDFMLKDIKNKRRYRLPSASMLNKKILIVDDSNKNVISFMQFFGYFNYKIHTIVSFEKEALENDMVFDIVVVNQAKLTNLAIQKIKEIQLKYRSKLVVLSDLYSDVNDKHLQGLKVDSYLKNPFTQYSILNLISELYSNENLKNTPKKVNIKAKLKDLSNKKILVAEDNELNHKVIFSLLSHTDIEVVFVKNGKEAIELLKKGIKFDMILMDINMPILGGYETTQEIRKNSDYNNMPILALSADTTDEAINKAMSSGMQGYIAKPIVVEIFYKNIFDILSKSDTQADETSSEVSQACNEFKELSVSLCLKKCNNDEIFYKLILEDFKKMYKNSEQKFKKLCKEGKFKEAKQMAMDVRDVALNIGAYHLYKSAAGMEHIFAGGSVENCEELIKNYTSHLEKLFKDIDKYLSKNSKE